MELLLLSFDQTIDIKYGDKKSYEYIKSKEEYLKSKGIQVKETSHPSEDIGWPLKYRAKLKTDEFPELIKELSKNMEEGEVFIKEFVRFWIKGNEGRARVKFESESDPTFSIEIDFFLIKSNDNKWKIFRFNHAFPDEEYPM